ncbi:hypothetical protein ABID49_002626 [Bhargavaea ullalensis]|uniref:Uncharacterized protein n=1 Tax=Bhargavaea ullalensis TaxID=1265685 RepID=A0ABV2GFA0_9BACL
MGKDKGEKVKSVSLAGKSVSLEGDCVPLGRESDSLGANCDSLAQMAILPSPFFSISESFPQAIQAHLNEPSGAPEGFPFGFGGFSASGESMFLGEKSCP